MANFQFKIYRVEWQVNFIIVDQYGKQMEVYSSTPFASRAAAVMYRGQVAHEHEFVKERWIPNDAPHGYCECEIQYKEVLVK